MIKYLKPDYMNNQAFNMNSSRSMIRSMVRAVYIKRIKLIRSSTE